MPETNKPDSYKSINSSSLQLTKDSIEVSETDLDIVSDPYLNKVIEYRILTKKDETNDYYFIQYLGTILDYIERDYKGCLSEKGQMSLALNISLTFDKLTKGELIEQKELVRFCLNLTFSYAVCVLFCGMVQVYKDEKTKDGFVKQNPLPQYVLDDLLLYEEKAFGLVENLKKVLDTYAKFLEGEYRKIYNEEKHLGFYKQIFNSQYISSRNSFMPNELRNAVEMK